jgi:hypothetical protein
MLYVTDPNALIIGQENMAEEVGRDVRTIREWKQKDILPVEPERVRTASGHKADAIVAQSLWAVQSNAWTLDITASQENGRLGGRPKKETVCSPGSSAQARIGTTLVDASPLITPINQSA